MTVVVDQQQALPEDSTQTAHRKAITSVISNDSRKPHSANALGVLNQVSSIDSECHASPAGEYHDDTDSTYSAAVFESDSDSAALHSLHSNAPSSNSIHSVSNIRSPLQFTLDSTLQSILSNDPTVEHLDLSHSPILLSTQGDVLVVGLACNTVLKTLDLSHNDLSADACAAVFDAVRAAASIQFLRLEGNARVAEDGDLVVAAVVGALGVGNLLELRFGGSFGFGSCESERKLAEAISLNSRIKVFTLSFKDPSSRILVNKTLARNNSPKLASTGIYNK
ncbi:hypothetical protein HK100_011743 [Physocladia obscura]|uniref:Uncharacterized protein n=1 Tax=Physocladia obscura TaxID=109957 RepID=A0AAD5T1E1_9FUNG|nr:hypothetical protein HK100_011743 [Physocladia obscura]